MCFLTVVKGWKRHGNQYIKIYDIYIYIEMLGFTRYTKNQLLNVIIGKYL